MSIAGLLWIVAVSGLVAGAATAGAAALRRLGRPERGVWIAALAVIAALPFIPAGTASAVAETGRASWDLLALSAALSSASASLPEPARAELPWIPLLWGLVSLFTLAALAAGARILARRRDGWPRRRLDGDLVRVSDGFGPAVVGWLDPEVVVPEWAMELEPRDRRLILRHENEHRWARDPQLLGLGALLLAAAPWNPFAWLAFRGLRRAVEFDCDARVLASGASPRAYGRLLFSVQLDAGRAPLFAPALRESPSFLERRLETMTLRSRPVARARVAGLSLAAAMLAVVACETPRPSEPAAQEATTGSAAVEGTSTLQKVLVEPVKDGAAAKVIEVQPIVYVDGERASAMIDVESKLAPSDIERIEVIKGEAAVEEYGQDAENGVILIFTKDGGS